ncbi:MAG: propanediol utilization protein [Propionibacteriaceae bacterium]|jgi:putative phosphotransacetylase|nr:propanediol utilization protein [Propionibacteriaceae bacterium]
MDSLAQPQVIEQIIRRVVARLAPALDPCAVVIGISNRHVHLSQADLKTLFGLDEMPVFKAVRQPGEFAADLKVDLHGPKASFKGVRVMGPCRAKTQAELSKTDCRVLGLSAPITQSGHLGQAAPIEIAGPLGRLRLERAALVAARHIHMGPSHAAAWGLKDQDTVKVRFGGVRGGVMDNFIIRVKDAWVPEIHLDTDEANALNVVSGDFAAMVLD